jgi:hypothetical protein
MLLEYETSYDYTTACRWKMTDKVAGQMQATFDHLIHHLPSTGCRVVVAGQMQATFVHLEYDG